MNAIGSIVFWSASSICVDPALLRHEIPEAHRDLVRVPATPEKAIRRAMRRRQSAALESDWRWEEIGSDDMGLKIALAQHERDIAANQYRASTRMTALLAKQGGGIAWSRRPSSPEEQGACEALEARYRLERGFLTADDVRGLLVEIILRRLKGTRQKEGGAVYFVPSPMDDELAAIASAVKHAGVELIRFPVQHGVAQLETGVRTSLREEATILRERVQERLRRLVEDGKRARLSGLATAMQEAEELQSKARLYEHLISIGLEDVHAIATEAATLVRETEKALARGVAA